VKDPKSKPRFNVSLSTKFILFAVFVELLLVSGGFYTAYTFLSEQRVQHIQNMLASQVNLLAKEVELEKDKAPLFTADTLELNPDASFQVVDLEGHVYLDTKNKDRIKTQIEGKHFLFDLAKNGGDSRRSIEFQIHPGQDSFFGAYKKVLNRYVVMAAISKREVYRDTYFILEKFLYLGTLLCGIAFLLIVFFAHRIIKPIRNLTYAAQQISGGNFDFALDEPSNDEIGMLSSSFSTMSQQVKVLLQEETHKVRIKQEVSNVAQIQQSLLPNPHLKNDRYEIQSYYQSAAETGGDYWGYFELDRHLVTYIADATGHGLTSAMLTVAARGCFSALRRQLALNPELTPIPSQLLAYANDAVLESAQEELNMTMFVAIYSYADRTLTYANAGHNPAWIVRDENGQKRIEVLKGSGVRLGESTAFVPPTDKVVNLGESDTLFLYTDGLIDCENQQQEQYGKNRTKDFLTQAMQKHADLQTVRNALVQDFSNFIGRHPLADDITFALIKPKNTTGDSST
jgi:sigma-B regulation protein RsbU (phosphoserine phosphatase)